MIDAKAAATGPLLVVGSSQLAHTLIDAGLVDDYQLWFHPIVLGTGKRLFPTRAVPTSMHLTGSTTTPSGLVIVTYTTHTATDTAAA